MKPGRLPSIGITRLLRYYSSLRLLACSAQTSVALYCAVAAITRSKRDLPRYPAQLPSHAVPTTPESPPALFG